MATGAMRFHEHFFAALAAGDVVLEAPVDGTARDGGTACATVPLLGDGWRLVRKAAV
ncbi:MAG: hypothetical protein M3O61_17600 [Gemmatimonadota bacterium]|nr:hypothetical protein [Gemmatimonadota bacterium]